MWSIHIPDGKAGLTTVWSRSIKIWLLVVLCFSWLQLPSGTSLIEVQLVLTWRTCNWFLFANLLHVWTRKGLLLRMSSSFHAVLLLWILIHVNITCVFSLVTYRWSYGLECIILYEVVNWVSSSPLPGHIIWRLRSEPLSESLWCTYVSSRSIVFQSLLDDKSFAEIGHSFLHPSFRIWNRCGIRILPVKVSPFIIRLF